jgi:hypothetical protein
MLETWRHATSERAKAPIAATLVFGFPPQRWRLSTSKCDLATAWIALSSVQQLFVFEFSG